MPPEDENRIIIPTYGNYAGQHITVTAEQAEEAISAGIATDPFAPPAEAGEQPDEETLAKLKEVTATAERAWRGEPEEDEAMKKRKESAKPAAAAKPAEKTENGDENAAKSSGPVTTRDMQSGSGADYQTRRGRPKSDR